MNEPTMEVRMKVEHLDQKWEDWVVHDFFMEMNETEHAFAQTLARKISSVSTNLRVRVELD